jgi:pilus assembly protein CpaC
MNLRITQPAKRGAAKRKQISLGRSNLGRVCALSFLLPLCCGALEHAAAQIGAHAAKPFAQTQNASLVPPAIHSSTTTDQLHITVGRSVMLTSAAPLRRVYVGNPAVLQTYTSGSSEIVLTAKAAGVSSMVLWDETGGHRMYTVSADLDPEALRASFDAAFPGSSIHVDTGEGKVFLTGSVATDAASDAALKMATLYTKDVVNSLVVVPVHGKQVQLKLRIVEVDRTRLDELGVNIFAGGRTAIGTSTQQFSSTATGSGSTLSVSDPLNIFLYNAKLNVGLTVKDLEQKQILQVLAEPTLTTLSGLPAHFLSGGEFPFPVVQGGTGNTTAISIQFRPYGVKVEFTPTVNPDGSIRIKLSPEVSTLDYTNAVTISGFTIPALSTRQTETEVEIQNGQSFIVSGLLDHRTTEIMSKMPGISSIPILGELFRSKNFNHSVVELVIIVTATVVDPLTSSPLTEPEQPKMATPNLDSNAFDGRAHNLPKGISAPAQQSQPPAPTQPPAQPPTQTPAQPPTQPPTQTPAQPKLQAQTQTQSKPQAQPQLQQPAPQVRTDQP